MSLEYNSIIVMVLFSLAFLFCTSDAPSRLPRDQGIVQTQMPNLAFPTLNFTNLPPFINKYFMPI